jgi:hypothetical protein
MAGDAVPGSVFERAPTGEVVASKRSSPFLRVETDIDGPLEVVHRALACQPPLDALVWVEVSDAQVVTPSARTANIDRTFRHPPALRPLTLNALHFSAASIVWSADSEIGPGPHVAVPQFDVGAALDNLYARVYVLAMKTTEQTPKPDTTCPKCGVAFASLKWLRRHQTVWGHK